MSESTADRGLSDNMRHVDLSWQFDNVPINSATGAFPRIVARFGLSDRVDMGAWGGLDTGGNYGLAGRMLSVSAEVEKGARVSYGLRIGTRF